MKNLMTLLIVLLLFSCTEKAETTMEEENATTGINEDNTDGKKSFEGYITYNISLFSNTNEPLDPDILSTIGDSVMTFFSKNGYIMNYMGGRMDAVVYLGKLRQYIKYKQLDSLKYRDIGKEPSTLYSITDGETDKVVLGRKLKSVNIITSNYEKNYYFDPNIYMNPKYFENHIYGYEDRYYELAQSPYLYAEIVYPNMTVLLEATNIVETQLPDSMFVLPNLPMEKID